MSKDEVGRSEFGNVDDFDEEGVLFLGGQPMTVAGGITTGNVFIGGVDIGMCFDHMLTEYNDIPPNID